MSTYIVFDCQMEQFYSQLKLVFEIFTGALIVTSKCSPESAIDSKGIYSNIFCHRESKYIDLHY